MQHYWPWNWDQILNFCTGYVFLGKWNTTIHFEMIKMSGKMQRTWMKKVPPTPLVLVNSWHRHLCLKLQYQVESSFPSTLVIFSYYNKIFQDGNINQKESTFVSHANRKLSIKLRKIPYNNDKAFRLKLNAWGNRKTFAVEGFGWRDFSRETTRKKKKRVERKKKRSSLNQFIL